MFEPTGTPPVCVEVVITATSADWLAEFTRSLVDDHVVACGQVIAPTRAIFRRGREIHDEAQARVALHTRATLVPEIVTRADRDHPDGAPGVVALEVTDGDPEYLRWIAQETAAAAMPQMAAGRFRR